MAAAGAAAGAIIQAVKASGVIVGGLFSKNYQYLMSYKGIAFFTRSATELPLPGGAELVRRAS